MALTVNTNIPSLDAQRNVGLNNSQLGQSIERLSSGLRINKAADDAAGLAIATKMDAQVQGLNQAVRNANNAVSLVQTAEGGVNTLTDILQRLRELAVQASSADNTPSDRATTSQEAASLITEFTRVASTSQFNTMTLLDGSFTGKYFQIGANYGQTVSFAISDARGKSIGARAEYDAQIGGGVTTAINANFGAGEIKLNGVDVAPTSAEDDQYSVLDISSGGVTSSAAVFDSGFVLWINGTSVAVGLGGTLSNADASTIANAVQTAIIDASMTNVTARAVGSTWVLEAAGGTNLNLAAQGLGAVSAGLVSALGVGSIGLVSMWGSGPASLAVGNYNGESSAIAKAVAINTVQGTSGVLATAQPNVVTAANPVGQSTLASGDVYINGYDIGAVTVGANDSTGALATAINTQTGNTGVSASVDGNGKLVLTATDGRNITVTTKDKATGTKLGLLGADATSSTWLYRSIVRLDDPNSFTLTSASSLQDLVGPAGGTSLSVASDVNTFNVANIKLDTQDNAQSAILTLDAALNQVNNIRAGIGAIQNRLQFTVNNLQIASTNMSASESRIKDADFASEVATFTRNQIMVQAGVAMVAQANTVSQYALQLLR